MFGESRAFLLKTNALALAVGVIIGVALGNVVNSLVNDIIMPPVGLALGGIDFSHAPHHPGRSVSGAAIAPEHAHHRGMCREVAERLARPGIGGIGVEIDPEHVLPGPPDRRT